VLVASTLGLAAVSLLFMFSALAGWYYALPLVLFLQGMINASRFSSMNTLTLKDLPDDLASSGNSLLAVSQQLSISLGVAISAAVLRFYEGFDNASTVQKL
ncbi:multidrug transporter subunit MdtD, partial [Acinetobacter baumannii]|nr:multidrug transporter subunit MdtD [Acinetobacter baumannii]